MKKLSSPVYAIARQKSAAIRRLILAAAMLAGLLARWTAWPVRAELAGDAPPRQPRDDAGRSRTLPRK